MKNLLFLLLFVPSVIFAQESTPTHFEHGLSWQQVKEKAKKENKYVFVDCFTTWCGPCKYMAATVFPQSKVGAFFNANFVNVKVQIDKTAQDNEETKGWYADADKINTDYKIKAYPTFLIFSPQGELVHRIVGGGEADDFITRANKALNPKTQYYTLIKKYDAGEKDPEFLKALTYAAADAYDTNTQNKVAEDYIATQKDLYTKENLAFVAKFTSSTKSKGFTLILNNPEKVDAVLGKGGASKLLTNVILTDEVYPLLNKGASNINFDELNSKLKAKYASVDLSKDMALIQVQVYQQTKDWPKFQASALSYMTKYGTDASPGILNQFAWTVFENCTDPACVAEALTWSKRSIDATANKDPALIDTYANLLHKSGKTEEAIDWEQKALALVSADEKSTYQLTLDKMKKGEKTW